MKREQPMHTASARDVLRQLLASEASMRGMMDEVKQLGFVWNAERGCYVHPNGAEVWVET